MLDSGRNKGYTIEWEELGTVPIKRKRNIMKPTLTQRIAQVFGLGRVPPALRRQLEREAPLLYVAEGIAETVTLKDFRAPGVRCGWRKMGFVGFVIVTEKRLVAKARSYHHVDLDLTFADPRFQQITLAREDDVFSMRFDASLKGSGYSGQVEVCLHLPHQDQLVAALGKVGVRQDVIKGVR